MAHDQDDETPASPFSSTGFQLSALFLLVLLVAGIAIAIFHGGNGTAKGSRKQVIVTANSPSGTSTTSTTAGRAPFRQAANRCRQAHRLRA